ncbi:MAG: ATP-dependent DNA helicase RecG [Peptostreptococcales bacterium]|jgi:ATP-dependent DNA helicase RecG
MENKMKNPITILKGFGEKKAIRLKKLNIESIEDVLYSFPREYEDRRNVKNISHIQKGEKVLIRGRIISIGDFYPRRNRKNIFKLNIKDETGQLEVVFFNSAYFKKLFKENESYCFYGKIEESTKGFQMIHPEIFLANEKIDPIVSIYPLTEGISLKERRKLQKQASAWIELIEEYLPEETIVRHDLLGIRDALKLVHQPLTIRDINRARYRLIFEELLLLQTGLLTIKNELDKENNPIYFEKTVSVEPFIKEIPFQLTHAQMTVIREILEDMESPKNMNRLIQGDVGSGKTIVAAIAIFKAIKCGYQAALMAPTEILTKQHYDSFCDFFKKLDISIALLTGSTPKKDKEVILEELKKGKIDLLIGTHSVIQDDVQFNKVGLVVTDEQHRFGVAQRSKLSSKGKTPDVLVMTATPIPRTLALILYGDLDISIIHELPPNRKRIKTYSVDTAKRKSAYDFLLKEVDKGRQGYIVAPLIEESESLHLESVQKIYEECKEKYPGYKWGYMSGSLKQNEKDAIMQEFVENRIQILVSTVVIEVGVNVPNASIMIIENSERFGLAQLHQLRGRVGRGKDQAYCILISSSKEGIAMKRHAIMVETSDGFVISEKDLENRGPGDFFGTRQHGLPELKIANLFQHRDILREVQKECKTLTFQDPLLQKKQNEKFRKKMKDMFDEKKGFSI